MREKECVLNDHLGNVTLVFSDWKLDLGSSSYTAEILNTNNYYPFGMLMPGYTNTKTGGTYRYGYNDKEKDDDIKGAGNSYDFDARMYDSRLGIFTSPDPKATKYPSQSTYSAFNSNPILYNDPSGKSGEVSINKNTKTITITSKLILYGGAASSALAKSTAKDIQDKWNAAKGKVTIDGVEYKVKFSIKGSYKKKLKEETVDNNTDIKNNYIRVETTVEGNISYMDGLGSNTGYFKLDNIKAKGSTTEAHEFGHGYTLDHPTEIDLRGEGQPGIMVPRGTIVDPQYQYDPNAEAGKPGGTINPEKRKVTQEDIDNLKLDKLEYNKKGKAKLGETTNKYHEKTE